MRSAECTDAVHLAVKISLALSSYENNVKTLRANVFIMSQLGAFMMISLTKFVGSCLYSPSIPSNCFNWSF